MERGSIWWASLGEPQGSSPGYRRSVVIVILLLIFLKSLRLTSSF